MVHFSTIGPKLADEIPLLNNQNNNHLEYFSDTDKRFQFSIINSNQVLSLLNKLSKSKATGLDKISARLIRECADLICIPICKIFKMLQAFFQTIGNVLKLLPYSNRES